MFVHRPILKIESREMLETYSKDHLSEIIFGGMLKGKSLKSDYNLKTYIPAYCFQFHFNSRRKNPVSRSLVSCSVQV